MPVDACASGAMSLRVHDTGWYAQIMMREVFDVSARLSELEMREARAKVPSGGVAIESSAPLQSPAAAIRSALSVGSLVPTSPPATEPVTCRCGGGAACCFQAVIKQV